VDGVQSALNPASADAHRLAVMSWLLFGGGAAILALVMGLLLLACRARPERRGWLASRRAVLWGGVAFPVVTLSALLPYGLVVLRDTNAAGADPLRIEVVGEQFWWRVRYREDGGAPPFVTANEIRVPVGRPVSFAITGGDVIHSFWVPSLAGKQDMIPGRVNELHVTVDRPGIYRGQCAEFCGQQHALMAFYLIAMQPAAFEEWRRRQAGPAREPDTEALRRGQELFVAGGCGNCHAVRGLDRADGDLAPDLTHVGGRVSLGAGVFPNNVGTLAGWISDVQHVKEGARMPSYAGLPGPDLRALAAYLESLK
jgi:cytochrome c oxidase subunit 2